MTIERNAKLSCFQGAFPVRMDYVISADEYRRRSMDMQWPDETDETISTTGVWPAMDGDQHAAIGQDPSREEPKPSASDKLDELQKRLRQRGKKKP